MLVVPALLSLKPVVVEKGSPEVLELISVVTKKLRDPEEIVAKTARKLILELQKCYPQCFDDVVVNSLKNETERGLCAAIINSNEQEVTRLLYSQTIGSQGVPTEIPK